MSVPTDAPGDDPPAADLIGAAERLIQHDGIAGLPAAFDRAWGEQLARNAEELVEEALARPDGAVSRGPNRYYFAVHPERLRGLPDLLGHPYVRGLCARMLGPDYQFVEVGFDVPLPGAVDQPWHRDFPMPPEARNERRLTSLAFNATTVDVTPEMGPFHVCPGTHWEPGDSFAHGMFPPESEWPRYAAAGKRRCARVGDLSVRTGLTIHRGTANRSSRMRPVLILGAVAPEVETDVHNVVLSRAYFEALPETVRRHLRCSVVPELRPLEQKHTIEGLVMGA